MSKGSYRRINYALRPAKSMERKMFCEAFRHLHPFGAVSSYRYVGFGSLFFTDFNLLHKALNIQNMVSIEDENDETIQKRFQFNKPFDCITIEWGISNIALRKLSWDDLPTIVWLDYDKGLDSKKIDDINFLSTKLCPGSILLVSVNVSTGNSTAVNSNLEKFREELGADRVPDNITPAKITNWDFGKLNSTIIHSEISQAISDRNGLRPLGNKFKYQQLFNFHYADNAKMLTTGGIIYTEMQESVLTQCNFKQHCDFIRFYGEEPYLIPLPSLTYKEVVYLDSEYHKENKDVAFLPPSDVEDYFKVYRYFPRYAEAEI